MKKPLLDMLQRPINVGDQVLVKGYNSTDYILVTVQSTAKVNIYVTVSAYDFTRDSAGHWTRNKKQRRLARHPSQVIVVNEQLAHNRAHWPEYAV